LRDIERYTNEMILNNSVKSTVLSFVEKRQRATSGIKLLGNFVIRKLFEYEINELDGDKDMSGLIVHQANKLNKDYQIFHSRSYKKSENSCSYLVKYIDQDRLEAYGYIEYFIGCDEFCSTYAYIQHIDTSTNNIKDQLLPHDELVLEDEFLNLINDGSIGYFYQIGCVVDSHELIDVKQIVNKCIAVSFGVDDSSKDFMFITEFDNENEHD
jgi:hypothetical protein